MPPRSASTDKVSQFLCLFAVPAMPRHRLPVSGCPARYVAGPCCNPSPFFSAPSGFFQRVEPLLVEAFLPDTAIERLDEGIVGRRTRTTERQFDALSVRPCVEGLGGELRTSVDLDHLGQAGARCCPLQDRHNPRSRERAIDLNGGTLTTHGIHYREESETLPAGQAFAHAHPSSI